jgi:hypothetical protein
MNPAVRWRQMIRAVQHLRTLVREWEDGEYQRYVQRCTQRDQSPLDRGRYFARRLEERYRTTSRCC